MVRARERGVRERAAPAGALLLTSTSLSLPLTHSPQRLYQALTGPDPPPGPPCTSPTHFAALPAGPGTARPLHSTDAEGVPGVTTFRINLRERRFVDELVYRGWALRVGDWVHVASCDDPGRPIVAQVFKCWLSEEP